MALVRLVDLDGMKPLHKTQTENYFEMSIPQYGEHIKYYPLNKYHIDFEGSYVLYKVVRVTRELQEYWDVGYEESYKERFEVEVVKLQVLED
ncbi:hypothetical protein BH753_gp070 [Bacillus phage Shbh1]|uniref:Uncharacterized protein n=1 Tax=Bacillus phage Shbh1 TaxID=1796992 RepID=A0A142F195_9CAUD|nr:hypothetical protein BH753_gp070 [Bacillus phage Shbh1]AMQ66552.1 hypothetical protein [Bacillus phage Shbh1]